MYGFNVAISVANKTREKKINFYPFSFVFSLLKSGEGRWTSDTGKFLKLLKTRNNKHIIIVLNLYKIHNKGTDVIDDIKRECSRTYAEALIALSK